MEEGLASMQETAVRRATVVAPPALGPLLRLVLTRATPGPGCCFGQQQRYILSDYLYYHFPLLVGIMDVRNKLYLFQQSNNGFKNI
jgi:hypothetical protein